MDFRQACNDRQELDKAAKRFAAYRMYCKERKCCPHVSSHRNVSGFRLACTPATGDLITLAMHKALCEHQHPLPFEFERAAALYEIAFWSGYLGSCADSKLDPEEFARFILANENLFEEIAMETVLRFAQLSIQNKDIWTSDDRVKYHAWAKRVIRTNQISPEAFNTLTAMSEKWIRRETETRECVARAVSETATLGDAAA